MAAALEGQFAGPSYDQDGWLELHGYAGMDWSDLVDTWYSLNLLLARVLDRIPEERLIAECIRFARQKGYRTLTLWTNDILVSARRIYQRAGFTLTSEEKHNSFGYDLVAQNWDLDLQATADRR